MNKADRSDFTSKALALLTIPYAFTQDRLLTTEGFIAGAKERGHQLTLDILQDLHNYRILIPLYRVSDIPINGRRIDVAVHDIGINVHGWTFQAALDGRLRDATEEGYSAAWPYRRPKGKNSRQWWNGFVYSSWQLRSLSEVLSVYTLTKAKSELLPYARNHKRQSHEHLLTLLLAALSTKYLPGILGRISIRPGTDESKLLQHRFGQSTSELIDRLEIAPKALKLEADRMLSKAHSEPLAKWISLIRYAKYDGWSKLRGEPLEAMWKRVAAEVLLCAYEDLSTEGLVDPLPDLTKATIWAPQHDRLSARHVEAPTLERALADLGLSPHPKVILIVEGKTERSHIPSLLSEFGLSQPQDVRVQDAKSSKINPHLIARYGITPRIGRRLNGRWLLDASPTALFIVMDPENSLKRQVDRDELRRKLQNAVREEVQYQDADISQEELDYLIHVHSWGSDKYELANFTDDELVPAITTLAITQGCRLVSSPTWEKALRAELQIARSAHADIKIPLGRMKIAEEKVELAKLLWSTLRAKCEREYEENKIETPVLEIVLKVRELHAQLTGVSALLGPGASNIDGAQQTR